MKFVFFSHFFLLNFIYNHCIMYKHVSSRLIFIFLRFLFVFASFYAYTQRASSVREQRIWNFFFLKKNFHPNWNLINIACDKPGEKLRPLFEICFSLRRLETFHFIVMKPLYINNWIIFYKLIKVNRLKDRLFNSRKMCERIL